MGFEQTAGVAYGVSFVDADVYSFAAKVATVINNFKPETIANVEEFAKYPQSSFEDHYMVLKEVFPNIEFEFWFDQDNNSPVLLPYVTGSYRGITEKYESMLPSRLGGDKYSHSLDNLLSSTGYDDLVSDWIFFAYVF